MVSLSTCASYAAVTMSRFQASRGAPHIFPYPNMVPLKRGTKRRTRSAKGRQLRHCRCRKILKKETIENCGARSKPPAVNFASICVLLCWTKLHSWFQLRDLFFRRVFCETVHVKRFLARKTPSSSAQVIWYTQFVCPFSVPPVSSIFFFV